MAIDIRRGNTLIVTATSKSYAVRYVGDWTADDMNTAGFKRMANVAVTVMRQPFSTEEAQSPVVAWSGNCTPLDPLMTARIGRIDLAKILKAPFEALQTFAGDDSGFKYLLLEDIQD